jgi:hypothetical protein
MSFATWVDYCIFMGALCCVVLLAASNMYYTIRSAASKMRKRTEAWYSPYASDHRLSKRLHHEPPAFNVS